MVNHHSTNRSGPAPAGFKTWSEYDQYLKNNFSREALEETMLKPTTPFNPQPPEEEEPVRRHLGRGFVDD